jgi:hypothetical protein
MKLQYPKILKGDHRKDFFEQNPEYLLFPELIDKLKKDFKAKKRRSNVMWAFHYKLCPLSFFETELDEEEIKTKLGRNLIGDWSVDDWEKFKYIEEWYVENVLITDVQRHYVFAKRTYNRQMREGKLGLAKMNVEKSVLEQMRIEAYSEMNEAAEYWRLAGDQPGPMQRTIKD